MTQRLETSLERNLTIAERCDRGLPVDFNDVQDEAMDIVITELHTLPIGTGDLPDWLQDIVAEERNEVIDTMCQGMAAAMGYDLDAPVS